MTPAKSFTRREFIGSAAASAAFTIVPRNTLGGPGYVPPSDKLTIGYVGCGTQGMREMVRLIQNPEIQIVSVCDPNKFTTDYVDWSLHGIRDSLRRALEDDSWAEGIEGIPGGRDIGQNFVQRYYGKNKPGGDYKGCPSYEDFREMFEKEKDIDAVKVMTPDHLHATISIAAIRKGMHVVIHKPIANRIDEARKVFKVAREHPEVSTHLLAWSIRPGYDLALKWIRDGAIGTLKEIHNWSNRPVWPQFTSNPADSVPVPKGFNWDLWLGCVPDRPYHPDYTHALFRGWYDFGGGSIADMGHYSLWPLFLSFGITRPPLSAEARGTTTSAVTNHVSRPHINDVAFPASCVVRFKFPEQESLPPFDLYWHDGGMKPPTPDELEEDNRELDREGMMFVGEKGKILAGFRGQNPRIIPERKMKEYLGDEEIPEEEGDRGDKFWIDAFKSRTQGPGSFWHAGTVTETTNLGAIALRARKKIAWDSKNMKVTNDEEANKFLYREYRAGWEL